MHPEPARLDVLPAAEEMRQDGAEVGECGEDDEGADERVECYG